MRVEYLSVIHKTEPICRVMIEGKMKILEKYSEIIPNEIRSLIGFKS